MRTAPRVTATAIYGVAFVVLTIGLFVWLGAATVDDPQCPGGTNYSIWGRQNACEGHVTGWHEAFQATDIMNYNGAGLVAVTALTLTAGALAGFKWPRIAGGVGVVALGLFLPVIMLFSIGLQNYTSRARTGLGLHHLWGWYVLLAALPLLFTANVLALYASKPLPAPPRDFGQKPVFVVPPRGIRARQAKPMRILPDFKPEPRPEPPQVEAPVEEPQEPGQWKTRLRGDVITPGKFRF